jgi:hypothetical protein
VRISAFTGNGRRGSQDRTEVLWSNRPLVQTMSLFDEGSHELADPQRFTTAPQSATDEIAPMRRAVS